MNLKRLACALFALVMILGMCPVTQVFSLPVDEDGEVINLTGEYVEDEKDYIRATYQTTGDALIGESINYDSAAGVDSYLDQLEDVGINRIYWRGLQQFMMSEANGRAQNPWISLHETLMGAVQDAETGNYHGLNLDQYLVQEARKRGIEVIGTCSLWDFHMLGDAVNGAGPGYCYWDELGDKALVDQYGLIKRSGVDYSDPEYREFYVAKLMQWMKTNDYDGIQFLTYSENYEIRFDDQFGYSDYAINDFVNNIYKRNGSWVTPGYGNWSNYGTLLDWQMHRGDYITQFFRELRTEMDNWKEGCHLGVFMDPRNLRQSQHWYAVSQLQPSDSSYFDYETWFQEGLVTDVIVYGANDIKLQKKAIEDLMWMARGTDARIGPYTSYPWTTNAAWDEYYKQGGFTCGYWWRPFEMYGAYTRYDESYYDAKGEDTAERYWLRKAYLGSVDATMEELTAFLDRTDNNYYPLTAATIIVTKYPEEAAPILEKLLTHSDPGVRARALMLINGQFSSNKKFFTENTFDQILRAVTMDGDYGSIVMFDVGSNVLQELNKEDPTVNQRLWEIFSDNNNSLYLRAFAAHALENEFRKVSGLTAAQAHAMITGDGEYVYDLSQYNSKDPQIRMDVRLRNYIAYYLVRIVAAEAVNGNAQAMDFVESYINSKNSAFIYFATSYMNELAVGITGDQRTWCLEQLETVFQRLSDSDPSTFDDDFKDYGAFYIARFLGKFGADGKAVLDKYFYGDDVKLAVAAWRQMYMTQPETGFVFMTEKEYAEAYTKLPEAMMTYERKIINQTFENYSMFTPALTGLAGEYRKDPGRWGGYDRSYTFISSDNSFSGRQSTLFKGSMGSFYSATEIGPEEGKGYLVSMWVYHDGGAKFYASMADYNTAYDGVETGFMISEDGSVFLPDIHHETTTTNHQLKVRESYTIDTGLDIPLNTWIQVNLYVDRAPGRTGASVTLVNEANEETKMAIDPVEINPQGRLGKIYYDHVGNSGNSKTFIDDVQWLEKGLNTSSIRPQKIIYEDGIAVYDGKPKELLLAADPSTNITSVQYVYYDEDGEIMYELPVNAGIYSVTATVLDGGDYQGETFTANLEIRRISTEMQGTVVSEYAKVGTVLKETKFITNNVKVVEKLTGKEVEGTFQWEQPGTWVTGSANYNYVFVPKDSNYKEIRGTLYVPAVADKYITGTVLLQNFDDTKVFVPGKAGNAVASGAGGTWAGLADSINNGSVISTGTYTKPVIIPPQNQALVLKRGAGNNIGRVSLRGTQLPADAEYEITYRLFWQGAFNMYIGYGQDPNQGDSFLGFDVDGNLTTFNSEGAQVKNTENKIPKNAWSTIKLATNRAAGTYTVTVTPDEGQAFTVTGALQNRTLQHIYFLGISNNTQLGYLDDFKLDKILAGGQRETVYIQNFNDTTYFSATKYATENVVLNTGAGGQWRVDTTSGTKVLVAELVSNIGRANPNYQSLHLFRGRNNGDGWTNVRFAQNIAATEDYEISFRLSWQSSITINFGYSAANTSDSYLNIKDGYVSVHDSSTGAARQDTTGQITPGVWTTYKIVASRATGKYTVTITPDGGTAFTVTGDLQGKELSRIYFQGTANNTNLGFLDDLEVVKKTADGTTTIVNQDFENTDLFDSTEALTATKEIDASGVGGKWNMRIESGTSHKWIHSVAPTDGDEEEEEEEEEEPPAPVEKKDVVSSGTQALKMVRLDGNKGHVTVTLPNTIKANQDYTFSCRIYQPESRRFGIFLGGGSGSINMNDSAIWLPAEDGLITIFDATDYSNKETGYALKTGEWATLTLTTNRVEGTYTVTLQHDTDLEPAVIGTAKMTGMDVSKIVFSCGYVVPEQTPCVMAYIDDLKLTRTYPNVSGIVRPTYKINLAEGLSGASSATLNDTCYFTVDDWSTSYIYDFEVWMGDRDYLEEDEKDETALYFQDYKNGKYSIYNVTDDVKVTFTKRAKTYSVTGVGMAGTSLSGAARATYGQDYSFKINENPAYDYLVKVLVRGLLYEPERDGDTYTIAGKDITGPIVVQINVTPCTEHTGGHAACGEKARCERCNMEYGRVGDHELTKVEAKAPSYNEDGNVEYYTCSVCEKYFSDERAKIELKRRDLKVSQLITYSQAEAEISKGAMDLAITEAGSAMNVKIVATNEEYPVSRVTIPQIPLMNIAKAGKTLTIVTDKVSATMDQKMMSLISQGEGGIILDVKEIDLESLNDAQKAAMAEHAVWQAIEAELISGGETIHDFAGGKVTMKVSFTPEEGVSAREYQLWYIAEDGTIEKLRTRYENDQLVVNMTHFSQYIIVRTGMTIEWYVWALLAVLILSAAAIVVLIVLKKRKGAKAEDAAEEASAEEIPAEEIPAEEIPAEEAAEEVTEAVEELSIEEQIEKAIQETTEV